MNTSRENSRDRAAAAFHSAAIRLLRILREVDQELGVGPAQLSALSVLVFAGPQTLGDLASIEQVRPPTMTRIAQGLVDAGLARRERDANDGRVAVIAATPRGRRVIERGRRRRLDRFRSLLADVSDRDIAKLETAATILRRVL